VVDDGSTDDTAERVRALDWPIVRLIQRPVQGGKGAAVRTGVLAATRPWILIMDADMAIPMTELPRLRAAAAGAPIVIGSKRMPDSTVRYPRLRSLGSGLASLCIRTLVVRGFRDTQCGFKLFHRAEARELFSVQRLDGFGYDFEVLHLAVRYGHEVREVPVRCDNLGPGRIGLRAYLRTLREALAVAWWRFRRSYPKSPPPILDASAAATTEEDQGRSRYSRASES